MRYIVVATIVNESNIELPVGYSVLEVETGKMYNPSRENLINNIKASNINVENVDIRNNTIVGTNGVMDRYAKVSTRGQLVGQLSPLVILEKVGTDNYKACNYQGKIVNFSEADAINYCKTFGIANGKVTTRYGKEIISSISGNYIGEDIESQAKFKASQEQTPKAQAAPAPAPVAAVKPAQPAQVKPAPAEQKVQVQTQADNNHEPFNSIQWKAIKKWINVTSETTKQIMSLPYVQWIADRLDKEKAKETYTGAEGLLAYIGYTDYERIPKDKEWKDIHDLINFIVVGLPLPDGIEIGAVSCLNKNLVNRKNMAIFMLPKYKGLIEDLVESRRTQDIELQESIQSLTLVDGIEPVEDMVASIKYYIKINATSKSIDNLIKSAGIQSMYGANRLAILSDIGKNLNEEVKDLLEVSFTYSIDYNGQPNDTRDHIKRIINGNSIQKKLEMVNIGVNYGIHRAVEEFINEYLRKLPSEIRNDLMKSKTTEELVVEHEQKLKQASEDILSRTTAYIEEPVDMVEPVKSMSDDESDDIDDTLEDSEISLDDLNSDTPPWDEAETTDESKKISSYAVVDEPVTQSIPKPNIPKAKNNTDDKMGYLRELTGGTKEIDHISVKIALDILGKGLKYDTLSYKQKFRVNDAIKIYEDSMGIKHAEETEGNADQVNSGVVNNTYKINEVDGLQENIRQIQIANGQNVDLMKLIKAKSPKIIEICESILKYNKVSDKQLRHVNIAMEILNRQEN